MRNEAGDDNCLLVAAVFRWRAFRVSGLGIADAALKWHGTRGEAALDALRRQHALDPRGRREAMRLQFGDRLGRGLPMVAGEIAQGETDEDEHHQKGKIADVWVEVAEHDMELGYKPLGTLSRFR